MEVMRVCEKVSRGAVDNDRMDNPSSKFYFWNEIIIGTLLVICKDKSLDGKYNGIQSKRFEWQHDMIGKLEIP